MALFQALRQTASGWFSFSRGNAPFHVSAYYKAKREDKFSFDPYVAPDDLNSRQKKYTTYAKRRKRAEQKKDLLGWRSVRFTAEEMDEVFGEKKQQPAKGPKRSRWWYRAERAWKQFCKRYKVEEPPIFNSSSKQTKKQWPGAHDDPGFYDSYQWWSDDQFYTEDNFRSHESQTKKRSFVSIGLPSDRLKLGLSVSGPLTIDEVKTAYRSCALKWHPDRHQGQSKVLAEENFKACGAAYAALCSALGPI